MRATVHWYCSFLFVFLFAWAGTGVNSLAATYYVTTNGADGLAGTNWATAKLSIQAGVNVATNADDIVVVSNGTYFLTSQISISSAITVRGFSGNPADTIVNGSNATGCLNLSAAATVAGLTLTNGNAANGGGIYMTTGTVTNCRILGNRGTADPGSGGVYMLGGSLVACEIVGNTAFYDGGGVFMNAGTVIGCTFVTNTAARWGGAIRMDGGSVFNSTFISNFATNGPGAVQLRLNSPVVSNCVFIANSSGGTGAGAVSINNTITEALVYGCTITSNTAPSDSGGAGISVAGGVVENCVINHNRETVSDSGGMGLFAGIVRNCLFFGNYAPRYGGGVRMDGGTLENCTIVGNQASDSFGGIWNRFGILRNLIIYSNTAPSSANYDGTMAPFTNSCTTPLAGGTGNITNNPQFVAFGAGYGTNHVAGDYHLKKGSDCINTGTNLGWMASATDLDGNARILAGTVDMGAYEAVPPPSGTMFSVR